MLSFIQPGDITPKARATRHDEVDEILNPVEEVPMRAVPPVIKQLKKDPVDEAAHVALPYIGVAVIATWVWATLDLSRAVESAAALAIGMVVLLVGTAIVAAVTALRAEQHA